MVDVRDRVVLSVGRAVVEDVMVLVPDLEGVLVSDAVVVRVPELVWLEERVDAAVPDIELEPEPVPVNVCVDVCVEEELPVSV
jgi:hypothetical protein